MDSTSGEKWKTFLKSGSFRRRVYKYRSIIPGTNVKNRNAVRKTSIKHQTHGHTQSSHLTPFPSTANQTECLPEWPHYEISQMKEFHGSELAFGEQLNPSGVEEYPKTASQNETLRQCLETISELRAKGYKDQDLETFLRNWSIEYRISHQALKPLLQKLSEGHAQLPTDPRRLLRTPRSKPLIHNIEGGYYWHHSIG